MVFANLQTVFTASGIHAVFYTLAHSLWIGAIMALLAGLVISFTKRSGPQLRYCLLSCLLIIFVISIAFIFCYKLLQHSGSTLQNFSIVTNKVDEQLSKETYGAQQVGFINTVLSFIESRATLFVSAWLLVIVFKCIQLVTGLGGLGRLRTKNVLQPGAEWNEKLHELTGKLGITKHIVLLQSSFAKVPMVIGHLKPVILFPVGLLNALPQNEVEAILLHELAHIKRNDFLVNILQQFAEIIFFFNPAVLWISALIKNERENCCDDIAIAVTNNKKQFIHALVAFQEYKMELTYATTFPGTKNQLLNRVKRIITNNNKTLNNMEKLVLASGIIITCLATAAVSPTFSQTKDKKEVEAIVEKDERNTNNINQLSERISLQNMYNEASVNYVSSKDTVPKEETTTDSFKLKFDGDIDGKNVQLIEENNKIKELIIDGKKIPEEQYSQYKPLIDKIHKQMKEQQDQLKINPAQLEKQKQEMQKQLEIKKQYAQEMQKQKELMQDEYKKEMELMQQNKQEMQKQIAQMKQKQNEMQIQSEKLKKDFLQQQEQFKLKQQEFNKKIQEFKLQQQKLMKDTLRKPAISGKPAAPAKPDITVKPKITVSSKASVSSSKSVTNIKSTVATVSTINAKPATVSVKPVVHVTTSSIADEIIRDLEAANIISDKTNLSFRLTNDELIVNGVKQPADLHQKILKKYMTKAGDTISFSYNTTNKETK